MLNEDEAEYLSTLAWTTAYLQRVKDKHFPKKPSDILKSSDKRMGARDIAAFLQGMTKAADG